jgi:exosome complex component RRP4
MGNIIVESGNIVIPGELLADGMDFVPSKNCHRQGEKVYSSKVGIVEVNNRVLKVIPLSGKYIPNRDDIVVGVVEDIGHSFWLVEIGAPNIGIMPVSEAVREYVDHSADLTRYFDVGDKVLARVNRVSRDNSVQLSTRGPGLRKLAGGKITKITSSKVPRVIGKKGSMINMIKEYTETDILVGQNGWVWVRGKPEGELRAIMAINKIDDESHTKGLTDRIEAMLKNDKKGGKSDKEN